MGTIINRAMPRGMPTPKTNQTLICKSAEAKVAHETIHTVTAGKTFYLMGFLAPIVGGTLKEWVISFDGGTTKHLIVKPQTSAGSTVDGLVTFYPGYPIAQVAAGSVISCLADAANARNLTIFGWEE